MRFEIWQKEDTTFYHFLSSEFLLVLVIGLGKSELYFTPDFFFLILFLFNKRTILIFIFFFVNIPRECIKLS